MLRLDNNRLAAFCSQSCFIIQLELGNKELEAIIVRLYVEIEALRVEGGEPPTSWSHN